MMTPERFEQLSAFLDDELDEAARAEVEVWLFRDPEAREQYRALRGMRGMLAADPEPTPLPLRLDLALSRQAEQFLAGGEDASPAVESSPAVRMAPITAPTFWDRASARRGGRTGAPPEQAADPQRPWLQMSAAIGLALLAVIGMGIFAQRGGSMPALSSVERRITGLTHFGHEAMYLHVNERRRLPSVPVETRHNLEAMLDKRLDFQVTLPQRQLGAPLDARIVELDDQPAAMADYLFQRVPVTMIAMPREVGIERLDIVFEPQHNVCAMTEFHQCYSDGRGTSMCVQTDADLVRLWVAHLPVESLDKLVRKAQ